MNYKIIYFDGESFSSLINFKKAYMIDIDGIPTIIAYDNGQRIKLEHVLTISETDFADFGKLVKVTTETQTIYAAVVLLSFKGGMAVAHNLKTTNMATSLKRLCGFEEDTVERYGYYEVPKKKR